MLIFPPFDNNVTLIYFKKRTRKLYLLTVSLLLSPFSLWLSRTASSCWPRCGTTASRAGGDDTGRSNWSPASSSDSCFLSSHWYGGRRGGSGSGKKERRERGMKEEICRGRGEKKGTSSQNTGQRKKRGSVQVRKGLRKVQRK